MLTLLDNASFVLFGLSVSLFVVWLSNHFKMKHRKNAKSKMNDINMNIASMNMQYDRFYVDTLGSPSYMMAPMVLQSDLPFRMMCRKYKCKLCYTPMVRASEIIENYEKYGNLNKSLLFHKYDRPLIIQLCSNKPTEIVKAAKIIESLGNICDAIDINLGCPQRCAKLENFGAFLLDQPDIVENMIISLVNNVNIPICAKIRILPTFEETLNFTKMLIQSGISMLVIHGRRREKTHHKGPANLDLIKQIKQYYFNKLGLKIPIISNGNIITTQDVKNALQITNCDGIMSACGILRNPYIFDFKRESYFRYTNGIKMCWEYLKYVEKYGVVDTKAINDHLLTFCEEYLNGDENKKNWDIRRCLRQHQKVYNMPQFIALIEILEIRLKIKQKITKTKYQSICYNQVVDIKKNKIINFRLEALRKKKKKKIVPYSKRVNALFEQNDSDDSD